MIRFNYDVRCQLPSKCYKFVFENDSDAFDKCIVEFWFVHTQTYSPRKNCRPKLDFKYLSKLIFKMKNIILSILFENVFTSNLEADAFWFFQIEIRLKMMTRHKLHIQF